jgi:hypothetical protein
VRGVGLRRKAPKASAAAILPHAQIIDRGKFFLSHRNMRPVSGRKRLQEAQPIRGGVANYQLAGFRPLSSMTSKEEDSGSRFPAP